MTGTAVLMELRPATSRRASTPTPQTEVAGVYHHRPRADYPQQAAFATAHQHRHRQGCLLAVQGQDDIDVSGHHTAIRDHRQYLRIHLAVDVRRGEIHGLEQHLAHALVADRDQGLNAVEIDAYLHLAFTADKTNHFREVMALRHRAVLDRQEIQAGAAVVQLPLGLGRGGSKEQCAQSQYFGQFQAHNTLSIENVVNCSQL